MDYSIRIPTTKERFEILESKEVTKRKLPKIKDYLFKPKGVKLSDFHPDKYAVRLREFTDEYKPSTLQKFNFIKADLGYTDEREDLGVGQTAILLKKAEQLGYEKWGVISTRSIEYTFNTNGDNVHVLYQELIPIGNFLQIESENQEGLNEIMKMLSVNESEKIEKNAATLLGEKLDLI